ncbi:MAG: TlyA family RNA methyltransferase [Eggerthellaceae bacterium]|nr:TlyA family RNA methyltransferase [Eggerthellaceae bacterium]
MKKIRLDKLLVERGVFADEAEALRAVLAHEVKVGDAYATSAAMMVLPDAPVEVKGRAQYVSRGGLKLRGALDAFGFDAVGLRCIDVGCSTGGFTDCLLQAGAASVACVDVGYGDLAWKLRQDPRTTVFERTNIRLASPKDLGAPFDLIVADLSFIGLASLAAVFASLAGEGGVFIGLVKPQFESRHDETDERGVVRDEAVRVRTIEEVAAAMTAAGFTVDGVVESSITGKRSGNVEYLLKATREN